MYWLDVNLLNHSLNITIDSLLLIFSFVILILTLKTDELKDFLGIKEEFEDDFIDN